MSPDQLESIALILGALVSLTLAAMLWLRLTTGGSDEIDTDPRGE